MMPGKPAPLTAHRRAVAVVILLAALFAGTASAQPAPAPPTNVTAEDHRGDRNGILARFGLAAVVGDGGERIDVTWSLSSDDVEGGQQVLSYEVFRAGEQIGVYRSVGKIVPGRQAYRQGTMKFAVEKCDRGADYYFKVRAVGPGGARSAEAGPVGPVQATRQPFDASRFWMGAITFILCTAVIYWIRHARKGKPLKVRKIAGLEAVDEAVGRATEMGRSCLFIPGIQDMNDIQTIAGIIILARVSRTAAEYDARVEVPTSRSLVMTTARETVEAAFLGAGRPDAYNEDLIYYVTDEQFGYVAYLQGMMVREKPAACFYMGSFFAESLILAETGNSIGAIQVAGTAQPAQLPFFVAACDYTLIGEEFFAASAYLSGSPEELGSLKGQDVGKVVVAFGLLIGVACATIASVSGSEFFYDLTEYIRNTVMT